MGGKLNIYNLGSKGNNVTKSPIHLEDGEFRKSQNLFVDVNAADGGVRKRNGLNKLNSAAAGSGGSAQGVVNLPYPASKTTTIYAGIGRLTASSVTPAEMWRKTANAGTSWADESTAPVRAAHQPHVQANFYANAIVSFRGLMYYAGDDYTQGTDSPTIHVWDGEVDNIIAYIPSSPATGNPSRGVTAMTFHRGQIAICVEDVVGAGTCNGRVFLMDPYTGELEQVGPAVASGTYEFGGLTPFSICSYQNRLWVGAAASNFGTGKVFFMRPGIDSDWTLDEDFADGGVCSLAVYKGKLYAALSVGSTLTNPVRVMVRTTLGVWSASYTSGATSTSISYITSLIVFGTNLYCIEFNNGRAAGDFIVINRFDGSSWTQPYSLNDGGASRTQGYIGGAIVVDSAIYFVIAEWDFLAATNDVLSDGIVLKSTDGTSWTESTQKTNLSGRIGYVKVSAS